jgi:hypothetical protein
MVILLLFGGTVAEQDPALTDFFVVEAPNPITVDAPTVIDVPAGDRICVER